MTETTSSTDEHKSRRKDAVAVAVSYDGDRDRAPKVVASGRGSVAAQILQIAFDNGVKVRKDADLAELLSAIELNGEIPAEAFAAVAEILVYVYHANGNWPGFLDEAFGDTPPNRETVAESEFGDGSNE